MTLNVLLLEDDPSKKNKLLSMLNGKKDLFCNVDVSICTSDALRKMTATQYDLLIADIVVPSELGGEKNEEHCIAMFERLDDCADEFLKPKFSLPVSSSGELSAAAYDFFSGRPWGILPYDESNDESLDAIEKVSRFVLREKESVKEGAKCDIFIVTALIEPEFSAIENLELNWGAFEPLDASQLIRFGSLHLGDNVYRVAAASALRMGPVAASTLTTKAMLKLQPRLVIMAGICAGIPGKTNIGDVVAADLSWDWQSGKYVDKSGSEIFEISPHQISISDPMRNQLTILKRDQSFWNSLATMAIKAKTEIPKLVIAPMATGSSVLADSRVSERIKTSQHKNVAGLDMETYGVYAAVDACNPRTNVICLKSVCDMGDKTKNDEHQTYASNISALTVLHFLKKYTLPLI